MSLSVMADDCILEETGMHHADGTVIGDIGIDDVPEFQKSYDNHALKEHCH